MTEAIQLNATAAPGGGGRIAVSGPEPAVRESAPPVDSGVAALAAKESNGQQQAQAPTVRDIAAAAQELQKYARRSNSDLAFRVDEDLNRVVVAIVDREDGTVLRQIPGEEALRIARAIAKLQDDTGGLMQEVA